MYIEEERQLGRTTDCIDQSSLLPDRSIQLSQETWHLCSIIIIETWWYLCLIELIIGQYSAIHQCKCIVCILEVSSLRLHTRCPFLGTLHAAFPDPPINDAFGFLDIIRIVRKLSNKLQGIVAPRICCWAKDRLPPLSPVHGNRVARYLDTLLFCPHRSCYGTILIL